MKIIGHEETLNNLKKQISVKLSELAGLTENEKKKKSENMKEMMRYYAELSSKVEESRNRIHRFGLQILAVSVASFGIIISQSSVLQKSNIGELFFLTITSCIIVLIMSAVCSTVIYQLQTWYRFPFLKLSEIGFEEYGNRWKWFYYGNKEILNINPNPNPFRKINIKKSIEPYLKGLLIFISNYRDEDLNSEITEDVTQLYLLQVHNYYKNKFHLQLTKVWLISFAFIFPFGLTSVIFYVLKYMIN